jgi:hypothetical protein
MSTALTDWYLYTLKNDMQLFTPRSSNLKHKCTRKKQKFINKNPSSSVQATNASSSFIYLALTVDLALVAKVVGIEAGMPDLVAPPGAPDCPPKPPDGAAPPLGLAPPGIPMPPDG